MMREWLVVLGFSLLATHELDAMTQSEWRLLFVLRDLPEPLARDLFVVLHVPLFALLIALLWHASTRVRCVSRTVFAAFLVVHAAIHHRLSDHPLYQFEGILSQGLILVAALVGAAFLISKWITTDPLCTGGGKQSTIKTQLIAILVWLFEPRRDSGKRLTNGWRQLSMSLVMDESLRHSRGPAIR